MTDFGWHYPPGAKNDPRAPYNEPDRTHEHRWRHEEQDVIPVIEDGAAIFSEKCQYAEGRYGDGWQCEETRSYRFEYSWLETRDGEEIEVPTIRNWEEATEEIEEAVIAIEERYNNEGPGGDVTLDVDPDPEHGIVTIEWDDLTLNYEPQ